MKIEIMSDPSFDTLNECLDCHHQSTSWAEIEGREYADGEAEVFCPNCFSGNYFIKEVL
jgi:hypothetical protein